MESGDYESETATQVGTGELDRTKSPAVDTAVSAQRLQASERGAAAGPGELHHPPQAPQTARPAG